MTPEARLALDRERTPLALYGELFVDVQMQQVFADGKTFADATPRALAPAALRELYAGERQQPGFVLRDFVHAHFNVPHASGAIGPNDGIRERIDALWPQLVRRTEARAMVAGADTMLPLPQPFVVPGGRFRELYYWDSYFAMLGLVEDGHEALAEQMLANFASLIDRYGFVPNANRTYLLSRSQPPLFFKMVQAVGPGEPGERLKRWLPQMKREHAFWMQGEHGLAVGQAQARVVRLRDGSLLNRYWDAREDPREESYRDDVLTARASRRDARQLWRDLRAGAESGWDFSSRWCAVPDRLDTIETTSILPVDLNALLFGLEQAIARACTESGDTTSAAAYAARAQQRAQAVRRLMWHPTGGHFVDYHWARDEPLQRLTAAALTPLYAGLATPAQAQASAESTERHLLARNGLLTTRESTGQQWDAPNGWAPLQWIAVQGLRRYGHQALAHEIATRWMAAVHRVYLDTGRLMEKYDVTQDREGGGGEYPSQDGFGWTNGVYVAMARRFSTPRPVRC